MRTHQIARDRQPQPRAAGFAAARLLGAEEWIENLPEQVFGQPRTVVLDADLVLPRLVAEHDARTAAVLDRVVDQVLQRTFERARRAFAGRREPPVRVDPLATAPAESGDVERSSARRRRGRSTTAISGSEARDIRTSQPLQRRRERDRRSGGFHRASERRRGTRVCGIRGFQEATGIA